jgi:hypothetical protein
MASLLKKMILFIIISMAGLCIVTELPWGQKYVKAKIERSFQSVGLDVSLQHVDIVLPFFIRLQGIQAKNPLHKGTQLFSCQTLIVSPLIVDIPFHRFTLLMAHGEGIDIDADALERVLSRDSSASEKPSAPFAIAIHLLRIHSLHVKSHRLPGKQNAVDCSLRGRFFLSADRSRGMAKISISKNTPSFWPKRVDLRLTKKKQEYSLYTSIHLSTEGIESLGKRIFGPNDRLDIKAKATLRNSFDTISLNAFEKIEGTWRLSCAQSTSPLIKDYLLQHSGTARGTISYSYGKPFSTACDDLQALMILGRPVQKPTGLDGESEVRITEFEPLRTLAIKANGDIQAFSTGTEAVAFSLSIPQISMNDTTGCLEGKVDCSLSEGRLFSSAAVSGDFARGAQQIPLRFAGEGEIVNSDLTLSGDLVASCFRASSRYQVKDSEKNLWTTLRCQDLSIFQPFITYSLGGAAEVSSHLIISGNKSSLSLSGNAADLEVGTMHLKNGDLRLSTELPSIQKISLTTDVMGVDCDALSLDQGHICLSVDLKSQLLRLIEARTVGRFNNLGFDLFGSGIGQTNGKKGYLSIDRLEGKIGGDTISVQRPFYIEHIGLAISSLSGSLGIGQEGRATLQWLRPTLLQGVGDITLEKIPLQHIATSCGFMETTGTFDGQCHYQATADNVIATAQAQAHITQAGVIGGPDGGIALGGTLSVDNYRANAQACVAGMGIKEPLMISLSAPVSRIPKSPWIFIPHTSQLQGKVKGDIHLSQLLAGWMPEDAGFEAIIGCDLSLNGSVANPILAGPVHLRNGRIDLLPTGEVINDIQMDGNLENRQLSVYHVTATDDKTGVITGSGTVEITQDNLFRWQADLDCTDVEVISLDYATAVADGSVKLIGDLSSISISGSAIAKKALIDLAARFPSNIPEIEVKYREEEPVHDSPYNVFFDLSIDVARNLEIKGRGLASRWDGHLHLGDEVSELDVEGILRCLQGSFTLSTKELTINEGSVICSGNLFKDSRMNLIANIDLPSINAQVSLRGSLETPKIAIQSTPPRPENEILSLILFNKEFSDISPLQSLQLANTAMTLQHPSGPFDLLDRVKNTFGIDLIDFGSPTTGSLPPSSSPSNLDQPDTGPTPDVQNDVSLKVGKYISEGVAVTVSKNVTTDENFLGIEAQVAPEITAEAEIGDDQEGIISLKWKKNY